MTNGGERSPAVRFFGWLLMGAGGLIAVTAGACSLFVLGSMLISGGSGAEPYLGLVGMLLTVMMVGGIPFGVGAALFFAGRTISRPKVTRRD